MRRWTGMGMAAVIAMALTGCATTAGSARREPVWVGHHGRITDADQLRRDWYRCTQESRTVASAGGTGLIGIAMIAAAQQQAQNQANTLYLMCMSAAGYRPMSEAEIQQGLSQGLYDLTPEQFKARLDVIRPPR